MSEEEIYLFETYEEEANNLFYLKGPRVDNWDSFCQEVIVSTCKNLIEKEIYCSFQIKDFLIEEFKRRGYERTYQSIKDHYGLNLAFFRYQGIKDDDNPEMKKETKNSINEYVKWLEDFFERTINKKGE